MQKQAEVQLHVNNLYHGPDDFNDAFEYEEGPQLLGDTEMALASEDGSLKFIGTVSEWFYRVGAFTTSVTNDYPYDYVWDKKNLWFKNNHNGNILVVLSQPKEW